jgi:1,4-dihydroxy-2-naphthoyl-CoA hydrolase
MMIDGASIWFKKPDPVEVTQRGVGSANQHVGIEITEVGPDYLKGRIPVDERTRQPGGVLHGGVSVVLAETLASWGAEYAVDSSKYYCVGQEVNANHIRAVKSGWVYGIARPLHLGRKSHVWEVLIRDENENLVCISRLTIAVLNIPSQYKKAD